MYLNNYEYVQSGEGEGGHLENYYSKLWGTE